MMKRRDFLGLMGLAGGYTMSNPLHAKPVCSTTAKGHKRRGAQEIRADLVVAGGGLGGVACALSALRNGLCVVLTEETDWIGGQLSQQGVPPDEHRFIETHGATLSYRKFRSSVRDYYIRNYPLTADALGRKELNPGNGNVSRLCAEPRAYLAVLTEMLAPYISSGKLIFLPYCKISGATVSNKKVQAIEGKQIQTGKIFQLTATYFVDATELGDLLPLTGTAYVRGAESKKETGELHAPEKGNPDNQQAFTLCFAMDYQPGENHVIDEPETYKFWKSYIPDLQPAWSGPLLDLSYSKPSTLEKKKLGFHPEGKSTGSQLNLWNYRRIIDKNNFLPGTYKGDITIVNWPLNDYLLGNLIDVSEKEFQQHINAAKQLNLSLLYWLQTEAPRADGGLGWKGLRLRPDIMGTIDGMAKYPYVREARRIKALYTILEEHVGVQNRTLIKGVDAAKNAEVFFDSVGIGAYHLDLHPSTGGDNYIDTPSLPFQIPLGALIPAEMDNLLPACKNIGTTHITNGCYRLHPVEWNIGESVGMLVAYALKSKIRPLDIRENPQHLSEFQRMLMNQGVSISW